MTRKLTQAEFINRVKKILGDDYIVLGNYINNTTKILMKHVKCGKEFYKRPADILNKKQGCSFCGMKRTADARRTKTSDIEEYIKKEKNNEFSLVEHYMKNNQSRVKMLHKKCGTVSDMTYQNFKNSCGCSYCAEVQRRKTRKRTTDDIKEEIFNKFGTEYEVLGEYTGIFDKIKIRHNKCGTVFEKETDKFLRRTQCPKCTYEAWKQNRSLTNKEFLENLKKVWGNEYTPLDEYKRNFIKIRVKHNRCGHIYKVVPSSLLDGTGCPECCMKQSKASRRIEKYLKEHSYEYEKEFKIDSCRNILPLPFDFMVIEGSFIKCLIEFDGEQHYKEVDFFGGVEQFKLTQKRDKIKNDFCKNNGIKLLRIKYDQEKEIEKILDSELH